MNSESDVASSLVSAMSSSCESLDDNDQVFLGGRATRTVDSGSDYENHVTSDSENDNFSESEYFSSEISTDYDNDDDDEIYGTRTKKKKSGKRTKRSFGYDSDSDDSMIASRRRKQNASISSKRKPGNKVTSGIVSDESEEDEEEDEDEDDDFKMSSGNNRKKEPFTGEIEFRSDWSDRGQLVVDVIGDWNEEKNEFLVKWKGRSWQWSEWLSHDSPELASGRRKIDNFIRKIEEERGDSEDQISPTLETLRFNLLTNWRVLERVVSVHETLEGGNYYLCKWRALGYSECTWEWEGDVRGFAGSEGSRLLDEFMSRQYNAVEKGGKIPAFHQYKQQPEHLPKHLSLRPYQLDGLNWLLYSWSRRINVILADEMGLGKTIQSVCFLTALKVDYKFSGPTLLVVPLSTIDAWQREFSLWAGSHLNVVVYTGDAGSRTTARKYEFDGGIDVLLTTYELVLKDQAELALLKWRLLLVDEGHRLKNASSQLYDVLFGLVRRSGRVLITGTPLQNSLGELWCLLRFLMPEKFQDYEEFLHKYSVDFGGGAGVVESDTNARLEELHGLIKPHILRRLKRDVEHSLLGKREKIVRVDLTPLQKQLYRHVLTRNYRDLKRTQEAAGNRAVGGLVNILGELKKICNHPLLLGTGSPALAECSREGTEISVEESGKMILLKRLLERLRAGGHRVLIFSQSVKMLDILESFVRAEGYPWQRLDGSCSSSARHLSIEAFNAPDSRDFVFLLSTRAGGLGINLQTADTVIIYDSDWNPQNDLQAMARAHRIGQKKLVRIFRLVSAGSVEEEIVERAKGKMVLDHLVIQQLKGANGANGVNGASCMDLQAILKFGAKSLFDADSRAVSGASIDIDALLLEDEEAADNTGTEDDSKEFLGQFQLADLGSVPNWDDIIPEAERVQALEAERRAEQLAKDLELQEALLTAASGRRRRNESDQVANVQKISKPANESKMSKTNNSADQLVLFPSGDNDHPVSMKCYESLTRHGISEGDFDVRLLGRLDELISESSNGPLPCHFRVLPGSPLQKASLPSLLDRVRGLQALQQSLLDKSDFADYRHGLQGIKAPSNWPIPSYSVQHDSALLVAVSRHGYGNWQQIRQHLVDESAREWALLQGPQLTRRVDYLLKEFVNKSNRLIKSGREKEKANRNSNVNTNRNGIANTKTRNSNVNTKTKNRMSSIVINTDSQTSCSNDIIDRPSSESSEIRIIEKFRRPFKPLRSVLLALEALKSTGAGDASEVGTVLTEHLLRLGDFIESNGSLQDDCESWQFIGCFWPFQKGSTGPELKRLYESLKQSK
jgi:chromodomain-helicase-DNA-binding protein 1